MAAFDNTVQVMPRGLPCSGPAHSVIQVMPIIIRSVMNKLRTSPLILSDAYVAAVCLTNFFSTIKVWKSVIGSVRRVDMNMSSTMNKEGRSTVAALNHAVSSGA